MQTIGEDQTLKALFRKLRLDDERSAPQFAAVWNSVKPKGYPATTLKFSFVMAALLLAVGLFSVSLWLITGPGVFRQQFVAATSAASQSANLGPLVSIGTTNETIKWKANQHLKSTRPDNKLAELRRSRLREMRDAELRNAVAVSSWQSPTAILMQSPADNVIKSLPQLNRSVHELYSYLPEMQK